MLTTATTFLAQQDADWQALIEQVGACTLQAKQQPLYQSLLETVAYQQLHARAALAILARFRALFGDELPRGSVLLATSADTLRNCGFSARKAQSLHSIAQAECDGIIPDVQLAQDMSDDALIERLTTLVGIGRWSVEMLLIFNLGRLDVFPAHDLGIQQGYQRLKRLPQPPKPQALQAIAQAWMPYRSIASWYLWRVPKDAE